MFQYGPSGGLPAAEASDQDTEEIDYPLIADWLDDLDNDPRRGRDGHNFAQYAGRFRDRKFIRIDQLADSEHVKIDNVMQWFEMEAGIASLILKYAANDVKKLKNQGASQPALGRAQPIPRAPAPAPF